MTPLASVLVEHFGPAGAIVPPQVFVDLSYFDPLGQGTQDAFLPLNTYGAGQVGAGLLLFMPTVAIKAAAALAGLTFTVEAAKPAAAIIATSTQRVIVRRYLVISHLPVLEWFIAKLFPVGADREDLIALTLSAGLKRHVSSKSCAHILANQIIRSCLVVGYGY